MKRIIFWIVLTIMVLSVVLSLVSCNTQETQEPQEPQEENCTLCYGDTKIRCTSCNGKGKELCVLCDGSGECCRCGGDGTSNYSTDCNACEKGFILTNGYPTHVCPKCNGWGRMYPKCTDCQRDGNGICDYCDGKGVKDTTCSTCKGKKEIDCTNCNQ